MVDELDKSITLLRNQNEMYFKQLKDLIIQLKNKNRIQLLSYFTYSLSISHDPGQESLCFGSYHLTNTGTVPLINPYICIKLSENSPFTLSGKYTYDSSKPSSKNPGGWQRMNEKTDKEEFWLKPINTEVINPEETISFSNFQVKWISDMDYAGSVLGFAYSKEVPEGAAVLNPISLNGTTFSRGDKDDQTS
ncbi:hypothetical protein [Halobacillus sp. A5]|uniref:hypothetical protein n=1 Tax=Halobacillus sp. A5 TaxID=2880263 RepID=UPI0020A65595|nr:hypothetical protein [Halobacillus sp. A5]MCP3029091.1 hypothetical protein [Halobacillus sp. A5]